MSEERPFEPRLPAVAREEVLEELWTSQESGTPITLGTLGSTIHAGPGDGWGGVTQELVERGWVTLDRDSLCLTEAGRDEAREVVRRHRLAEVLFHQVFELSMETTETAACRIEHELSPQVTDAVCSFLGHPPVCPHGRPIPPGPCCSMLSRRVSSLICRLIDLTPGERGRVVLVAPRHRERLEQLTDLGVTPGAVLTLRQRKPSLVVEVDRTLLALEDEIAEGIYLRPLVEW
ncbi:MAG TPA: metal-dependent transcriptional regulator [Thermoanaerobaculaceae bacterium]|nr:metal-dependent transcriptional regulator [Thermoanaerobaculaceae bacterium]